MTTDFRAMERQFIDGLRATTGRDLAEWMVAIERQTLPHRNDIIDWLRQQGFPFARASWLERIHDNGGRPLYQDGSDAMADSSSQRLRAAARARSVLPRGSRSPPPRPPVVLRIVASGPAPSRPPQSAPPTGPALDGLLATAKAYRPLAQLVLREIEKAVPAARPTAHAAHVSIGAPAEFAILAVGSRELRLGLDLGPAPFGAPFQKAKFGAALPVAPAISHMIVLTDARQVDAYLMRQVRSAAARTNGR